MRKLFLSTPSARRATCSSSTCIRPPKDFYPRPPRGGRPGPFRWPFSMPGISIHALREEGDGRSGNRAFAFTNFYPRPPRGGRLQFLFPDGAAIRISIHALREEGDVIVDKYYPFPQDFYPRPPRGGRRGGATIWCPQSNFYPRPPRGGRPQRPFTSWVSFLFLSTPSARRATVMQFAALPGAGISIHALREEGDVPVVHVAIRVHVISIHALREEGDLIASLLSPKAEIFLSTPSARRATSNGLKIWASTKFLSTPSARRATSVFMPFSRSSS